MAQLLNMSEAERETGIRKDRLYRMCREQIFPKGVTVFLGRRIFLHRAALEEFLRNGGQKLPGGWRREAK